MRNIVSNSISDRLGNRTTPVNPVLRWESGNAINTICVQSGLYSCPEGWEELSYEHPLDIWGDPADGRSVEEIVDEEALTDEQWEQLLDCVEIR